MIKFMLMGVLFAYSGYLGIMISNVYDEKEQFFNELIDLLNNIKSEISFLKTDIISILKKYKYKSKLENVKSQIVIILENGDELNHELIINIISKNIIIEQNDLNQISQMFCELGNLGYMEQIERLEYYINLFKNSSKRAKDRAVKMKPFCKKMGFIMGLLVCIVLI